MVGGKGKAAPAHGLIVVQIGAPFPPSARLDVFGEYAAQPQRIVPEVGAHEEAALRVGALEGAGQLGEGSIDLVVGARHATGPGTETEVEKDRRHVVGEHPVSLAHVTQRVPNDYV